MANFWGGLKDVGRSLLDVAATPAEMFAGDFYKPKYESTFGKTTLADMGAGIDKGAYTLMPLAAGVATGILTANPAMGMAAYGAAQGLQSGISSLVTTPEERQIAAQQAALQQTQMPQQYLAPQQIMLQQPMQYQPTPLSQSNTPQMNTYSNPYSDTDYWRGRGDIPLAKKGLLTPKYRMGGIAMMADMINIEKGELEVNPDTFEVIREFEAPKHPKDGSKNPKGNRYVKKGNAIIPADKAMAFKKGNVKEKQKIINSLPKEMKHGMAKEGGLFDDDNSANEFVGGNSGYWDNAGQDIQNPNQIQTMTYDPYQQSSYQYGSNYNPPIVQPPPPSTTTSFNSGTYFNPVGLYMGLKQQKESKKALADLAKQPLPTLTDYRENPELNAAYNRAESMTKRGFTPQEEAAFKTNLAQSGAERYNRGVQAGGGSLANAIQAGITSSDIGAINRFASQDAELRRRNIQYADSLARAKAAQQNIMTQGQREMDRLLWNRRQQTEMALGAALSQSRQNIAGSVNIDPADIAKLAAFIGSKI